MAKDDRIVVRMSAELRDWVHEQASSREMDDAAYVRMVLAEARSGVAATRVKAEAPLVVAPRQRDILDLGTAAAPAPASSEWCEPEPEHSSTIDVDSLVAATVADAEAAGLTQSEIEQAQGEMPDSGVRPLMRRPIPFSRGTQNSRLEQMFGGH